MVQITLTGNKISSTGGNDLYADLTGDAVVDIEMDGSVRSDYVRVVALGGSAGAFGSGSFFGVDAALVSGGVGARFLEFAFSPIRRSYLNPISFTDTRINGGSRTDAWLEGVAFNESFSSHTVQLTRLIFDDASTTRPTYSAIPGELTEWTAIPEPSSLGLLVLGAGGLLARRRRKAA